MPRVLIVEDDAPIIYLLAAALADEGFDVDFATDVKRGIELAKLHPADVALVDMMMPGDGATICDQLRTLYHGAVPTVLMSASGQPARQTASQLGARYLPKPFDLDQVADLVRQALGEPRSAVGCSVRSRSEIVTPNLARKCNLLAKRRG